MNVALSLSGVAPLYGGPETQPSHSLEHVVALTYDPQTWPSHFLMCVVTLKHGLLIP